MSTPPIPEPGADEPITRTLLEDGSLAVRATPAAWRSVAAWMPRVPPEEASPERVRAWVDVDAGPPVFDAPAGEPALALSSVRGWPGEGGRVLLHEPEGRVSAVVDPAATHASVRLVAPAEPSEVFRVESAAGLTLSAAFLLWRLERALVHAGAVIAPDGRAWLLVGASFSGKTTTCIGLIRSGWDYVADDQVVLRVEGDGVRVEGWPRNFNVDLGYPRAAPEGVRRREDPDGFGPGRWRRSARLGGILFPRVEASLPTAAEPVSAADALSGLLRQSPWLLADTPTAAGILGLLRRTAQLPAFRLRLGLDSYRDPAQLEDRVAQAVRASGQEIQTP